MLRHCLLFIALVAASASSGGCRSCSDCHDYDPPVAGCDCPGGINRAGSNSTCGYGGEGCTTGGCTSGCCSGGGHYVTEGEVVQPDNAAVQQYYVPDRQ